MPSAQSNTINRQSNRDNQIEVIHNNMGHVTNAVINLRSQAVICFLSLTLLRFQNP